MTHEVEGSARNKGIAKQIETLGWGAFFVWIGIVLLAEVPAGWALAIIGLITLGGQAARVAFGLAKEGFWLAVGIAFLVGGVWQLAQVETPLFPVFLIAGGIALMLASFWPKGWQGKHA